MSEYELHPEAYIDLHEIGQYIADDSPAAAKRIVTEIFDAIAALVPFPHQGHRRADLTSRPLRFIRVYDYLIAYAPDERPCGLWRYFTVTAAPASWPRSSEAEKINPANSPNGP